MLYENRNALSLSLEVVLLSKCLGLDVSVHLFIYQVITVTSLRLPESCISPQLTAGQTCYHNITGRPHICI